MGVRINAMAYADDLVPFSTSPEDLKTLTAEAVEELDACGLRVNHSKCRTLTLFPAGKSKTMKQDNIL